jgi:DivIVA domain-containing protein
MPFAPHEIEHKKFVIAVRGYAKDEVESFLRAVAADYRALSDNGTQQSAVTERREALVADREQSLAKRAAELALRERALQALERSLHERVDAIAASEAAFQEEAARVEEARSLEVSEGSNQEAEPLPGSEAEREAEREAEQYSDTGLDELERLVAANRDQHPELAESWEFTLYHLREYADVDGRLPLLFDGMIDEVFGPLLER